MYHKSIYVFVTDKDPVLKTWNWLCTYHMSGLNMWFARELSWYITTTVVILVIIMRSWEVWSRCWYSPIKSQSSMDKLVWLNINKVPSRKRHKRHELRLDRVLGTYLRTYSDYNQRLQCLRTFCVPFTLCWEIEWEKRTLSLLDICI